MSLRRSISIDSTSSSATIPTVQKNDQPIDSSNILYNDRQHHQTIFSNDSRFFDTSLHLYKSYRSLGYIKLDNEKSKRRIFSTSSSTLKPLPNGSNNRWQPKIAGFSSNHDIHGHPNGTLKPPFLKNQDHSLSHRSDPGSSKLRPKIKHETSPKVARFQPPTISSNHSITNDDSSDDPDVIITRL